MVNWNRVRCWPDSETEMSVMSFHVKGTKSTRQERLASCPKRWRSRMIDPVALGSGLKYGSKKKTWIHITTSKLAKNFTNLRKLVFKASLSEVVFCLSTFVTSGHRSLISPNRLMARGQFWYSISSLGCSLRKMCTSVTEKSRETPCGRKRFSSKPGDVGEWVHIT